ncbi:MAG: RasGEF domain-containing protein, partial [archaeon]|nr:RasGEF domain-containing protein [archaeon]
YPSFYMPPEPQNEIWQGEVWKADASADNLSYSASFLNDPSATYSSISSFSSFQPAADPNSFHAAAIPEETPHPASSPSLSSSSSSVPSSHPSLPISATPISAAAAPKLVVPRIPRAVKLTVVKGENLKAADMGGKSDPYFKISVSMGDPDGSMPSFEFKSKHKNSTLDPQWNQSFDLAQFWPGCTVVVSVFDWDRFLSHDFLGICGLIPSGDNLFGEHRLQLMPRDPKDKHIRGYVVLKIEAAQSDAPSAPKPPPKKPATPIPPVVSAAAAAATPSAASHPPTAADASTSAASGNVDVIVTSPDLAAALPEMVFKSNRPSFVISTSLHGSLLPTKPLPPIPTSNPSSTSATSPAAEDPSSSSPSPAAAVPQPEEEGLVVTGDCVKGGSLFELTRILFDPPQGVNLHLYELSFRMTYASFSNPSEVLHLLKAFFDNPESIGNPALTGKVVQVKICNFLQKWLQDTFRELQQEHIQFIEAFAEAAKPNLAATAAKILEALKRSANAYRNLDVVPTFSAPPPVPIIPTTGRFSILEVHPTELARQLTLIEHGLYRRIAPAECLNKAWTLKDKEERSPNVLKMIHFFNKISNMVASCIVTQPDLKLRVQTIEHFITLGETLRGLKNFNAINEIVSGLASAAVRRLNKTWEKVSHERQEVFKGLSQLMDPTKNYGAYRDAISKVVPPITPFVGTYLTDMVFIDEGNPDFLPEHKSFINFAKRQRYASVIQQLMSYKQEPYNFLAIPMIQSFLENSIVLSEEQRYQLSLKIEPRASAQN